MCVLNATDKLTVFSIWLIFSEIVQWYAVLTYLQHSRLWTYYDAMNTSVKIKNYIFSLKDIEYTLRFCTCGWSTET